MAPSSTKSSPNPFFPRHFSAGKKVSLRGTLGVRPATNYYARTLVEQAATIKRIDLDMRKLSGILLMISAALQAREKRRAKDLKHRLQALQQKEQQQAKIAPPTNPALSAARKLYTIKSKL